MSGSKNSNGVIKYFFLPPLPFAPRSPFLWLATSSVGLMCAVKLENAIWTGRTRMSLPDTFRSLNCFSLIWLKYFANPWTKHCWKEQVMTWLARSRSPAQPGSPSKPMRQEWEGFPWEESGCFYQKKRNRCWVGKICPLWSHSPSFDLSWV